MDNLRLGLALKTVRIKRRWRQADVAAQAGVSASLVSRLEHGDLDRCSLRTLRTVSAKLGISLDLVPRAPGGELEHLANSRHAALAESVASWVASRPGWNVAAEVSFAIYGERGVIDLLAWHEATGSLVLIELKTAIVDVGELIGTLDRKRRLAVRVAAGRGWAARFVSTWLIVGDSHTNRRHVADHATILASMLPQDGRSLASLFLHPNRRAVSGVAFWPNMPDLGVGKTFAAPQRVVKRSQSGRGPDSRLAMGQDCDRRGHRPDPTSSDRTQLPPASRWRR